MEYRINKRTGDKISIIGMGASWKETYKDSMYTICSRQTRSFNSIARNKK